MNKILLQDELRATWGVRQNAKFRGQVGVECVIGTAVNEPAEEATWSGESTAVRSFVVEPALPAGLCLNSYTGVISGVPETPSAGQYCIRVSCGGQTVDTTISICVKVN